MHSSVLILCHLVVWRIAQKINLEDLSFLAGATKTGSALAASACYMLAKSIFTHNKWKEVRSNAQIFNLSLNDTQDWIYNCRFCNLKGCVHYIFAILFCISKGKHLWNKEKCFLFHFESSFHSWDNQILTFQVFKCHDIIKWLSMKHETYFT